MKKSNIFISLLLSLILSFVSTVDGETIKEALGDGAYMLATNTSKGDAYVNSFSRTYNPSINCWGTHVGRTSNGDAIINLDLWTIADILGPNYSVLAYTPERGNCYVNANLETYTPGSNQYGKYVGRTATGLPIINVIGTIYAKEQPVITRTTTYYTANPGTASQSQPQQSQPASDTVYIYPAYGERYHSTPHNNGYYVETTLEDAKAKGYTACNVCW